MHLADSGMAARSPATFEMGEDPASGPLPLLAATKLGFVLVGGNEVQARSLDFAFSPIAKTPLGKSHQRERRPEDRVGRGGPRRWQRNLPQRKVLLAQSAPRPQSRRCRYRSQNPRCRLRNAFPQPPASTHVGRGLSPPLGPSRSSPIVMPARATAWLAATRMIPTRGPFSSTLVVRGLICCRYCRVAPQALAEQLARAVPRHHGGGLCNPAAFSDRRVWSRS
jgi:hypothetical protein